MSEETFSGGDIIPEIGMWLIIRGQDYGPGKVTALNFDRNEVTVDIFGDEDISGEQTFCFCQIDGIITDSNKIRKLEEELSQLEH